MKNTDNDGELTLLQEMRMILLPHSGNSLIKNILKVVGLLAIILIAVFFGPIVGFVQENFLMAPLPINPLDFYGTSLGESKIPETYPEKFQREFANMFQENPDIRGIIEFENGNKKYVVLQSDSNDTYKNKDFFKKNGSTTFIDSRSDLYENKTNTLVYGYKDKEQPLIQEVARYVDFEYFKENPTFIFNNVLENETYLVFSSFLITENPTHDDMFSYKNFINANNPVDFSSMINDIRARSIIYSDISVEFGDKIILLVTTSNDFDGAMTAIVAKKIDGPQTFKLSEIKQNPSPFYPEKWYEINGGTKPKIEPNPNDFQIENLSALKMSAEEVEKELQVNSETSIEEPVSSKEEISTVENSSSKVTSTDTSSSVVESSSSEVSTLPSQVSPSSQVSIPEETASYQDVPSPSSQVESSKQDVSTPAPVPPPSPSGNTVSVKINGNTVTGDATDIVSQIVAGEISEFYPPEAVKAQAVATYTFLIYENARGAVPEAPMREPSPGMKNIVASVIGQTVKSGGRVAFTPYYAISAGKTNSSQEVWGGVVSHLITVDSSFCKNSPHYQKTKTISESEVRSLIESSLGFSPSGDPSTWISTLEYTQGGYNKFMSISGNATSASGKKITGTSTRILFGLRSAAYDVSYSGGSFTFTTRGYGHGVGLSQIGAYYMAESGYTYAQILAHYYPGTTL